MIQKMVTSALIAGFGAGLLAALLHFAFVQQYILLGEQYESGALTHFETSAPPTAHDQGSDHAADATEPAADGHAHSHEAGEVSTLTRNSLTVLFAGLMLGCKAVEAGEDLEMEHYQVSWFDFLTFGLFTDEPDEVEAVTVDDPEFDDDLNTEAELKQRTGE